MLSTTGSLASTLGTIQPFRYRGYVYDVETGLYYLRSRYYNPKWGRFVTADCIINENLALCVNEYGYVGNNPVCCTDDSGTFLFTIIGGFLGFAVRGVYAIAQGKSEKEIKGASIGGLVTGAINGIGIDLSVFTQGIVLQISTFIGGVANFVGDIVEYAIIHDGLDGYDMAHGINQFITGTLLSTIGTLAGDYLFEIIEKAYIESLSIAFDLLAKHGIDYFEMFGDTFSKAFEIFLGETLFYNAGTQLLEPIELIPENR